MLLNHFQRALRSSRRALLVFSILLLALSTSACTSQKVSRGAEFFWQKLGLFFAKELAQYRERTRSALAQKAIELKTHADLPNSDAAEFEENGTYGKLPDIHVDTGTGAIYPFPMGEPARFSWARVCKRSFKLIKILRKIESQTQKAKTPEEVHKFFSTFRALEGEVALLFTWVRHLQTWMPLLQKNPPADHEKLIAALKKNDPLTIDEIREKLRPHRVWAPPYLPLNLNAYRGKTIPLLIATDIRSRKFLSEVEGAVETHWNQSPWARQEKIRFQIRWHLMPFNTQYQKGKQTLEQHLDRFPKHQAIMTTGAQSLHVQGRTLFLSPSTLTPRTLAHELGHLMGFADCYFRTVGNEGLLGFAILEWDNPLYPDDLMCENDLGVARAEIW